MKKTLFITSLLSLVVLSGCFNKTEPTDTNNVQPSEQVIISPEAQAEADKRVTGNQTCDNYLATIKCIAEKWGDNNEFSKNYESILASFTNIPVDQLQETCTTLSTSLQEHPTLLIYNAECDMITTVEENLMSGGDNTTNNVGNIEIKEIQ